MSDNLRNTTVVAVLVLVISAAGCATLKGSSPFRYVPSLAVAEPVDWTVGVQKLEDKRPDDDRSATHSIPDIDDKVTAKVIEDLRVSRVFRAVEFPSKSEKNDVIVKGEIKRFYWKLTPNPIALIPVANFAVYFGAPVNRLEGIATLRVQLVNSRTGVTIAEYEKTSTRTDRSTLYELKAGEIGSELAEAFRDVMKQIKDAIAADAKAGRLILRD